MASLDQIRRITIQATSTGTSAVAADLDRIATGQERVTTTAEGMVKATETTSRSVLSAARQFDALNRSIDPVAKAQAALDRGTRLANAALAQGAIDAAAAGRAVSILEQRLVQASAAHRDVGESASLNRIQQMELMHVSKSLFDQLAAGQSPMRALSLEGGRIAEIFSMGQGGVGGTLRGMAGSFLGMLSPMALAAGGLVTVGAAAAYALNSYEEMQRKLEASTNGVGRASGLSLGNLNSVADRGAAAGDISRSDAHDLAGTFNATGRIGGALSASLIATTRRYSEITGQETADAGAELAKAFADPTRGADLLNEKLGLLNDRTRDLIRTQAASGDVLGAQTTLFDAYNRDVASAIDHTTALGRVWRSVKTGVSDTLFSLGEGLSQSLIGTDAETNLRRADQDRKTGALPSIGDGNMFPSAEDAAPDPREQTKKWADAFIAAIDEVPKALRAQKVIEDNRLSIEAGDAIRKAVPDIGRRLELETSRDSLSKIMGNDDALSNLSATARDELPRAFDILDERLRNFSTAAQITATDSAFAVRSLLARSAAERAAIEVERAYTDTLRENGTEMAKAKAAAKLDEMVASGQKAIMDDARRSDQAHALIGLRPFERNLAEVQQRHDNLLRDNAIDASTAATIRLTSALDKATEALSGKATLAPIGPASNLPTLAGGDAEAIIRATAPRYGIDPTTAMRVFGRESGMSTAAIGDDGSSFGAFQMHYGGVARGGNRVAGMGDDYTRLTGFKAGDGVHTQAEADFAFSQIARSGSWAAFHAAAAAGVGPHDGIGGRPATSTDAVINAGGPLAQRTIAQDREDATAGRFVDMVTDADVQLNVMNERLALQAKLTGQSSETIDAAMKMQTLLDEAYQRGAIPLEQYTRGILDQSDQFRKLGERQEAAARMEADRRRAATAVDAVHGEFSDAASTISSDLLTRKFAGQSHVFGRIMGDVGKGLSQKLISSGIGQIGNGLFGQSGSPGGLLGGGIASLFGGGSSSLQSVDLVAQTVNLSGGGVLGSAGGGGIFGGGSSGGLLGGLFGSKPYINAADDAAQDAAQDAAGGGGLLSGLASIFHSGGMVGGDAAMRLVNVEAFRNAPRYHGGMGLAHDERRAILQTGEGVMSRSDMAGLRQSISAAKSSASSGAGVSGGAVFHMAAPVINIAGGADKDARNDMAAQLAKFREDQRKDLERHIGNYSQIYSLRKG